jgi:hypothetical protein
LGLLKRYTYIPQQGETKMADTAKKPNKIAMQKTNLPHIALVDVDESGLLKECAIVKEFDDGSIAYVDLGALHAIDKARIKKVVTSIHADKYPLFELLSQAKFSNGLNGLDYIHANFVKIKRPKGARASQDSLMNINSNLAGNTMIGSDFSNPAEVGLDQATKQFK